MADDEIQELNFGDLEGLTQAEVGNRFGLFSLDHEPFHRHGNTGESWAEFTFRTCRALDRMTRAYAGQTIVLVTHGGVIDSSFIYFQGLTPLKQLPIVLDAHNTSITHWQQAHFPGYRRAEPQWCLHVYNDYAHLANAQRPSS
jgi:probable phosphoglycerate mutase